MTDRLSQAKADLSVAAQRLRDIQNGPRPQGTKEEISLQINTNTLSACSAKDRALQVLLEEGGGDYSREEVQAAIVSNRQELAEAKRLVEKYR